MARAQYFVVLQNDEWKIKHLDKHIWPYKSKRGDQGGGDRANKSGLVGKMLSPDPRRRSSIQDGMDIRKRSIHKG